MPNHTLHFVDGGADGILQESKYFIITLWFVVRGVHLNVGLKSESRSTKKLGPRIPDPF